MSSEQKTTSDDNVPFQVNQKKLKELAENSNAIKIGGKVDILFNREIKLFVFICLLGHSSSQEKNYSSTS